MGAKSDIVEQALKLIFSGSKAVDEAGIPRRVYHGTTKDISAFKPGSYFTEDPGEGSAYTFWTDLANAEKRRGKYSVISAPELAGKRLEYFGTISDIDSPKVGEFYATDNGVMQYGGNGKWKVANDVDLDEHSLDESDYTIGIKMGDTSANAQKVVDEYEEFINRAYPGGVGGNVIPAYLNIKNPKEMSPLEGNRFGERLGADPKWVAEEIERLKAQGYDSIVTTSDDPFYAMERKMPPKQYVIFEPTQAKSAIGNTGEYDFTNPDITKAEGGSVREGYAGKGRVVGDVVEQALKLTAGAGEEAAPAMRYGVDEIPSHLKPGFKVDVAPGADAETRSLVEYLNQRDPNLAFDPQSLEERRQDLGVNVPAYHGSPRNISQFSNRYSNPEGYWGGHQYFTTSPVDASENYATAAGPDLTMRLEQEAENILENFHPNDVLDWHRDKYGTEFTGDPMDPKVVKQFSDDLARQNLGITNEGAVYPVNLRMKNPVVIDSPNQTFWPYNVQYDEDGEIISEGGPAADLVEKTRQALYDYGTRDSEVDRVSGALYDEISNNGGIDAKTYRKVVGENVFDLMDDNGNMVSPGHVMADVFQSLGYDSIDMATDVFAGGLGRVGMPGTGGSTRHYIVFDPKNIRSRFGAFDPFKASSKRISDADGGRVEKADGGGFLRRATIGLLGPSERKGLSALTPPGSGYKGVPGKPSSVKLPFVGEAEAKPIPQIMDAATEYLKKRGVIGSHEMEQYPSLDEEFAMRVAEAYDRMKHAPDDPAVRRSYDAMAQETIDQLKAAEDAGIAFTAIRGKDPYAASPSLGYADIAERGSLSFFPTDAGFGSSIEFDPSQNPLLKRIGRVGDLDNATVNDAFRIVHDLYGHYGPGNPFFRAPGEERAYLLHRRMYSPEALPAMTSETRGQNSWLNYGPHGPRNRNAASEDTIFADQKTGVMEPFTYLERADGGAVDDDIADAVRVAKQEGGILMEDAKGNKYDAQGNLIPPTAPGPNPARADAPQAVAQRAVADPATYDALMQYYAVPDRDIMDYEATREAVAAQPRETQQMTHVGAKPRREVTVDMPLFGGEYSMGTAPYDVAPGMSGMAQTAYDLKTVPFYLNPFTAPVAAGMDVAEGVATNDPLTASLAIGFGPGGKYAKAAGIGAANYFLDPAEAEAGPARWFSKAMEAAQALPMEKMTGQQALAMLRKSVSPEELRWTGAEAFLPQQKQITKQDLVDYLTKNRVQTQNVVLGGNKPTRLADVKVEDIPAEIRQKYEPKINELMEKKTRANLAARGIKQSLGGDPTNPLHLKDQTYLSLLQDGIDYNGEIIDLHEAMKQEYVDSIGGLSTPTKYQDYSTPGGQDYRETLIRLGSSQRPNVVQKDRMWHIVGPDGETLRNQSGGPYTYYSQADAERAAKSLHREGGKFRSGHWDEPDVISHVRSQILDVTPEGANRPYKAFNVDETQSDWAQAGRKSGVKDLSKNWRKEYDNAVKANTNEWVEQKAKAAFDAAPHYYDNDFEKARSYALTVARQKGANKIADELGRGEEYRSLFEAMNKEQYMVEAAPYISSTQGWTDLSIKKSLDQALDAGADYFTFTPGEAQAERFNLQKHISKVQYNPDDGSLLAYDPKGKMVINESISDPSDLDEYIGKELADKMRAEEDSRRSAIEEYEIVKDPETGEWGVYLYGEPSGETFPSKGHAKDYLNEMMANEFASSPLELSGLDLKTGGEGMIDYYNNIYKKRVEKVVKDATGQKVQWEVIPVQTADGPREQLGFRLTDDFQRARFSDFKKGGRVTGRTKYADSDTVGRALALTSEV